FVANLLVGVGGGAVGEQLAGFVDDRDPLRLQAGDGGGDKMADGTDLLRLQRAAHPHHDRGGGFGRLAREQRPLGEHEVHPRSLDTVDRRDGAGQLALERPQMVDVLDEARGAQRIRFVEDFIADAAALGQAAFGELHAQPRHFVLGDHDDAALVAQLVWNALAVQVLDDAGGVLQAEIGEEGGHLRRRDAHDDEGEEADERGSNRDHRHQTRSTQTLKEVYETLQNPPQLPVDCWSGSTFAGSVLTWARCERMAKPRQKLPIADGRPPRFAGVPRRQIRATGQLLPRLWFQSG